MSRYRCNSCGGTYTDIGRDGVPYFHSCAPVTVQRIRMPDGEIRNLEGDLPPGAVLHGPPPGEQANKRDENIQLDAEGKAAGIKLEGLGRIQLEG